MNERPSAEESGDGLRLYDIRFPADLNAKQIAAFVTALGGLLTSGPRRLFGVSAVVFELSADERGIHYTVAVPSQSAEFVLGQLRSLLPGVRVSPLRSSATREWTAAVEYKARRYGQTFHVPDAAQCATSLLASFSGVRRGECLMLQWVVTPALPEQPPATQQRQSVPWAEFVGGRAVRTATPARDVVQDQRNKLNELNVLCALRAASVAVSEDRARHLLAGVRSVLSSVRGQHNAFRRRWLPSWLVAERIAERRVPLIFPIQLAMGELVGLLAWPIGNPHVAGLPQAATRHLPASESIARRGRVVAMSNFPGAERPLALTVTDSCKHMHICGPTGAGKTALMGSLAAQDQQAGRGVVILEAKGDLFRAALERVPRRRLDDVIILDVSDRAYPVGFNVLAQGDPQLAVEELCGLFEHLYRDTRGVWTREVLFHGLATLVTRPELTFVDLAPLLAPMNPGEEAWRIGLIASVSDPELQAFWQRFLGQPRSAQDRIAQPVLDRIWQLNARPEIRHIIGQSRSSFTMEQVVAEGKILLINLSGLGASTSSLTGTLLMSALWRAVQSTPHKQPISLFLDEYQDFVNLPIDPSDFFVKARSYGLAVHASHQDLGQLPMEMRSSVLANARTKIVFQTTADDARAFAREFGRAVSDEDFLRLGRFEVLCRFATADGVSQPVTAVTKPPSRRSGVSEDELRMASRTRYGRPVAEVQAEIAARRSVVAPETKKRPKIGPQPWG